MTGLFESMCVSQQLTRCIVVIQAEIQPRNMPKKIEHTRPLMILLNETLCLSPCTKLLNLLFSFCLTDVENDIEDNGGILDIQIESNNGLYPLYIPYFLE